MCRQQCSRTAALLTKWTDMDGDESIVSWPHQNAVPLINQSMAYKKAITQSLHHIIIPGQLSVHWLINQIPCRWKQWPLRWWHLLSQQTTLEELKREAQKCIIPNYRCTADSQARGYNFTPSRRSVALVSISFHVLPVVKCEYLHVWILVCVK